MTATTHTDSDAVSTALQQLVDERAIIGVTVSYCWTLDGRAFEELGQIFTEHAVADYGEGLGTYTGLTEIAGICTRALGPLDASAHSVTNHQVEVDGDTATSRCYFQAQHVRYAAKGGVTLLIGGTYIDRLVRTATGWRIEHRVLSTAWIDGNREVLVL